MKAGYIISNIKIKLLIIYLAFNPFIAPAQNRIDREIGKISRQFPKNHNFYKAAFFFLQKNYDSTLIYATRHLEDGNGLSAYCRYFRGAAFKEKRMFREAEAELKSIPHHFISYPKTVALLGDIALEQNDFQKAVQYYQQVRENNEFESLGIDKGRIFHNIGLCYLHAGNFKNAEEFLFQALKLHEEKKELTFIIGSYMDIGGLYYEQYMDNKAITYYQKAYHQSKKISNNYLLKKNAALNMAVVEENRKNYRQALDYRKESEVWNDSLTGQTRIWQDVQHEKSLAIKDKQNEVNRLKVQNQMEVLRKNRILYISVFLLIILSGSIYFYFQQRKSKKIILEQKIRLDKSNTAKDTLFSIISHDLRSYIISIKNTYKKIQDNLDNAEPELLRQEIRAGFSIAESTHYLLNNLLHWALLQTDQLYFCREPINIYKITEQVVFNYRFLMDEKRINFKNKMQTNIKVKADQESIKIILRNILDNAIKYTEAGGTIMIYNHLLSEDYHAIVIEDNGKGMSKEFQMEILNDPGIIMQNSKNVRRGLGLQLCQSLIEKNSGIFKLESEENRGTKIIISLPAA